MEAADAEPPINIGDGMRRRVRDTRVIRESQSERNVVPLAANADADIDHFCRFVNERLSSVRHR